MLLFTTSVCWISLEKWHSMNEIYVVSINYIVFELKGKRCLIFQNQIRIQFFHISYCIRLKAYSWYSVTTDQQDLHTTKMGVQHDQPNHITLNWTTKTKGINYLIKRNSLRCYPLKCNLYSVLYFTNRWYLIRLIRGF